MSIIENERLLSSKKMVWISLTSYGLILLIAFYLSFFIEYKKRYSGYLNSSKNGSQFIVQIDLPGSALNNISTKSQILLLQNDNSQGAHIILRGSFERKLTKSEGYSASLSRIQLKVEPGDEKLIFRNKSVTILIKEKIIYLICNKNSF